MRIPGIGAFSAEEINHALVNRFIVQRLPALVAEKHGNRHAPDALARDAPVGSRRNHVGDALFTPRRIPDHLFDFVERTLPERRRYAFVRNHRSLHADEPLLGGPHDDGIMAAPAVRVGVLEAGGAQERGFFLEKFDDRRVGLEDRQVFIRLSHSTPAERPCVSLAARIVDILNLGQVISLPRSEVVDAMRRRSMDGPGSLIRRNVVRSHAKNAAVQKRMLKRRLLQRAAREERHDISLRCRFTVIFPAHQPRIGDDRRQQSLRDDVSRIRALQSDVLDMRIEGHGLRCRQRPGSRRPDNRVNILARKRGWIAPGSLVSR